MATEFQHLFTPLKIGPVEVRNRLANSGHFSRLGDPSAEWGEPGLYGERYARYLAERAKGGIGLVAFGQVAVHPTAAYELLNASIGYEERAIPGMKLAADMVHEHGAKIFAQLYHSGVNCSGIHSKLPVFGPSECVAASFIGYEVAHEMTEDEIAEVKEYYARTARHVRQAGMDGVELHSTHSYLLHTFLSPVYNRRTDRYGGSLENRMRFLLEVIDVTRDAIGERMALGVRIPGDELLPGGLDQEAMQEVARRLDATGKVDFLSVSVGTTHSVASILPSMYFPHAPFVFLAAGIKQVVQRAKVFTVGRIVDPVEAERVLAEGQADMVIMTRAHIADPEIGNKAREGRLEEIRHCVGDCQACVGSLSTSVPMACVTNPAAGREKMWGIGTMQPAPVRKRVMVVGGGPGGMEVAWVAAARGHDVTLYDKSGELGGQVILSARLPGRGEMEGFTRWRQTMIKKHAVKVKLNTEVTAATIQAEKPDAVVVATGSLPRKDGMNGFSTTPVKGCEQPNVVSLNDVLAGKATVGQNVVVYDAEGHVRAPGAAEMFADQGKRVRLVTPGPTICAQSDVSNFESIMLRLGQRDVEILTWTWITSVAGNTVNAINPFSGKPVIFEGVDTVVMCGFGTANDGLYKQLKGKVKELYVIGDAVAPRSVDRAIYDGHRVGRTI
jgi:mycofactocin system FadH/OYE family oxidoreductase 2